MASSFAFLLVSYLALFVNYVLCDFTIATPKGPKAIIITSENTLNATRAPSAWRLASASDDNPLQISVTNNLNSNKVTAYVTGLDPEGQLVMLQPDGQWFFPTATGSGIPVPVTGNVSIPLGPPGSVTNLKIPTYLVSGRVWFADGNLKFFTVPGGNGGPALVQPSAANPEDPSAAVNWGFVELTNIAEGLWANISFVDFLGLPLGMSVTGSSGTNTALGVRANAVVQLCALLAKQAPKDKMPWDKLCVSDKNGKVLRVLSPATYSSVDGKAFAAVFTAYVDRVWARFAKEPLVIDTQNTPGKVSCTIKQNIMTCGNDPARYAKPTSFDIFGCNTGPFAVTGSPTNLGVVPRLCAAFNRATLLLPRGKVQPSVEAARYYLKGPMNWYSKFVHTLEIDGKGYAFSYDDVTPSGTDDLSGLLHDPKPRSMSVTVGGPALRVKSRIQRLE